LACCLIRYPMLYLRGQAGRVNTLGRCLESCFATLFDIPCCTLGVRQDGSTLLPSALQVYLTTAIGWQRCSQTEDCDEDVFRMLGVWRAGEGRGGSPAGDAPAKGVVNNWAREGETQEKDTETGRHTDIQTDGQPWRAARKAASASHGGRRPAASKAPFRPPSCV
jgi:hypothetical protein